MTASEWAAWVQAVGSVAAVLLAIFLPRLDRAGQHRHAARACRLTLHEAIDSLWEVVATARAERLRGKPSLFAAAEVVARLKAAVARSKICQR